jgi:alanyl-tRNA synthetase
MLRILGAEKYKGMTRVTFIAGRRVLHDSRLLRQNADIISRSLSVPVEDTGKGFVTFLEKSRALEQDFKTLQEADAEAKAEALLNKAALLTQATSSGDAAVPENTGVVLVERYPAAGIEEILRIGRSAQKKTSAILVLASESELKFAAFCAVKGKDIRPLLKDAMEEQGGRGGGGPGFFQGSFSSKEALDKFCQLIHLCGS